MNLTHDGTVTEAGWVLPFTGVTISRDGITIERDLDSAELNHLLTIVVRCHDAANWYAGDVLAYIYEKRGEQAARFAARQFRDPNEIWDAMRVCQTLNGKRIEQISFKHHRTALDECRGDAKAALRWILRAKSENWKISELRSKIRQASAITSANDDQRPVKISFTTEIRNFSDLLQDLVTHHPIGNWKFEECQAFLADCKRISETIDEVQTQYASFTFI